ncbi:MAG: hypothetical protein A3G33_05025 [Omnitrophica bacterium RIFCSPLOWO2_12_FULL_44_17]|uniref:Uncharacterized protein n=1 Tax=Candidatus Danuiimicrobium aquiferis TaxID=1801832 RepID=A0A1G1KY19_9BACT|nr:MAG: hypothetical protein A3B72_01395 [Omnitrophica bacterium RIFCSPHIGHO2_02_FULL_45_28]OGW89140.1 MAG: hypothetical protein A3E74_06190 [Omnitrophica bacterium RIFCSPHIGHO2_12_FULL_44_12]OGW97519.1 MAG: hypothetical protein A3G33_05025 [Omnitrophica bacterium RIFCSPLOWO2_12_FULL_44_17]OGX02073.1 MAG: hypothetical protein A3J12_06320 [Omnitrophica bacterium RIFCSPLOWO2_02_FULL_44_11]
MNKPKEEQIKYWIKEYIQGEVDAPEIARAKKKLVGQYIAPAPFLFLKPVFWIPALSAFVIFIMSVYFIKSNMQSQTPEGPIPISQPLVMKQSAENLSLEYPGSAVINHVSSEVGPFMVYQLNPSDRPLTVIWMFPERV